MRYARHRGFSKVLTFIKSSYISIMFNQNPPRGLLTHVKRVFEVSSGVIDPSRMSTSTLDGGIEFPCNLINFPYRLDIECTSRRHNEHILMRSRGGSFPEKQATINHPTFKFNDETFKFKLGPTNFRIAFYEANELYKSRTLHRHICLNTVRFISHSHRTLGVRSSGLDEIASCITDHICRTIVGFQPCCLSNQTTQIPLSKSSNWVLPSVRVDKKIPCIFRTLWHLFAIP